MAFALAYMDVLQNWFWTWKIGDSSVTEAESLHCIGDIILVWRVGYQMILDKLVVFALHKA